MSGLTSLDWSLTLQFFDGYGYHGTSFEQTYRCYPASFIEKVSYILQYIRSDFQKVSTGRCSVIIYSVNLSSCFMWMWYLLTTLLQASSHFFMWCLGYPKLHYSKVMCTKTWWNITAFLLLFCDANYRLLACNLLKHYVLKKSLLFWYLNSEIKWSSVHLFSFGLENKKG